MFTLYLEPLCGTFKPHCGAFIGNLSLYAEPLSGYLGTCKCGTFVWNLGVPQTTPKLFGKLLGNSIFWRRLGCFKRSIQVHAMNTLEVHSPRGSFANSLPLSEKKDHERRDYTRTGRVVASDVYVVFENQNTNNHNLAKKI